MSDDTHTSQQLSQREIEHLADRWLSRGVSALFDPHYLQADMLLASALLRQVARDHPDGVTVDVWKAAP
jgi:hypothetical protein